MCHKELSKLIVGNTIVLPKVGPVKCRYGKTFEHENIKKIYNVTVKKSKKGDYYCSICCDVEVEELASTGKSVGVDVGIKVHGSTVGRHGNQEPALRKEVGTENKDFAKKAFQESQRRQEPRESSCQACRST